jgi:hypothetical protein
MFDILSKWERKWVETVSTPQDENSSHPIRLSLAGCSPAVPVSVSPDPNIITDGSLFVKPKPQLFVRKIRNISQNGVYW